MSCRLRSPQAVRPVTSRNEQVNRVVIRQASNNQTFTVCISFFFIAAFLKNLFMGKYMELVSYVFSVQRIICEVQIIKVKHYYSKA